MHRSNGVAQRSAAVVALAVASSLGLTACGYYGSPLGACPELGWVNELTVEVSGETADVRHLELCDSTGCTPPTGSRSASVPQNVGDGRWVVTLGMAVPERMTMRAMGVDGAVLAEAEIEPEWKRVGGSEHCGGPHEGHATAAL